MRWKRFEIFFIALIIASSCLNRKFTDGRAEIISSSDTTLNDSSFVFGHVYHVDRFGDEYYFENEFEIWIENSDLKTTNDSGRDFKSKNRKTVSYPLVHKLLNRFIF